MELGAWSSVLVSLLLRDYVRNRAYSGTFSTPPYRVLWIQPHPLSGDGIVHPWVMEPCILHVLLWTLAFECWAIQECCVDCVGADVVWALASKAARVADERALVSDA